MYGAVVGGATAVSVAVAEAGSTYTVEAQIVDRRATNLTWKARQCPALKNTNGYSREY